MRRKELCALFLAAALLGVTGCGSGESLGGSVSVDDEDVLVITSADTKETTQGDEAETAEEQTEEATDNAKNEQTSVSDADDIGTSMTWEEAEELLEKTYGTNDEETCKMLTKASRTVNLEETHGTNDEENSNTYSFEYVDTITKDGVMYYVFTWSWLAGDHNSKLEDLFVTVDGSAIYEGLYQEDSIEIYTETKQIPKS